MPSQAHETRRPHWLVNTAILGIIGACAVYLSIASDLSSLYDRWYAGHVFTPQLRARLQADLHQLHHVESLTDSGRETSIARTVDSFIDTNDLNKDEVLAFAAKVNRQISQAADSLDRGLDLYDRHRYADARREFASATELDGCEPLAWSSLGAAEMQLSHPDAARAAYNKAISLDPEDWRIRYNFGLFFARTGSPEEGLRHLRLALDHLRHGEAEPKVRAAVVTELRTDPGLASLRNLPEFPNLLRGL